MTDSSFTPAGCNCGAGLGEPAAPDAPQTTQDLMETAKKYVNSEIPMGIKIAAGLGVLLLLVKASGGS
ncbi:hypothetical protein NC796_01840 [Aliifodinibius sp. S!AR15-10]|uniref:hypothetical protein n=1 Tax=Aliifodinibius sp. S!AR15-10 TaxID=2950437 RepID=UPI00285BA451|nr:hypothetical protein [Aliifodinibius sp. S!AR15-10]MDR8389860.1 hypothetical protein [Aliifodinibius sp. S!AR15-10]